MGAKVFEKWWNIRSRGLEKCSKMAPGPLLGRSWGLPGLLGGSWSLLGRSLGGLGAFMGAPGAVLGRSLGVLGAPGGHLGLPGRSFWSFFGFL